ncbi:Ig-like domain-containing protein [Geomonas terrae]|nr:Ig-like domain-containing protein [Geomonas terrae]
MNKCYRLVWSRVKEAWLVVAENVASKGKGGPTLTQRHRVSAGGSYLLALEQRFMFDAAAAPTVAVIADDHHAESASPLAAEKATSVHRDATDFASLLVKPLASNVGAAATKGVEIAFVDATTPDASSLIAGIRSGGQVVLLDPNKDGIQQITDALQKAGNVSAIHIVGHGSTGDITLGSTELTTANLSAHAADLAAWTSHLDKGGDILIYGCNVAQGSEGQALIQGLARVTGADVAASTNSTGAAALGGDWVLESATGPIEASTLLTKEGAAAYQDRLSFVSLGGSSAWVPVMYGASKDPVGDSQAGAADTDIVGDAAHGSLYAAYDDNGTATTSDDTLVYRMRIDNPTSSTNFGGVAIVGIDANLDGRIDLFMSVDGRNNAQAVKILDPGTGLNTSPSTTTTSPLPTGWLANNGVYAFTSSNYSVVAVSSASDPNWNGDADLGNDGKTDVFVSWRIPVADMATVLAMPSPVDRNGVTGPRGTTGIQGFTKDTVVQYVNFTQTQPGPINGDLNGVGASYDKNATFSSLGAFTAQMSTSQPISAALSVNITSPIGDGNLSHYPGGSPEDASVTITGTTSSTVANSSWVRVTVSDGTNSSIGYTQVSGAAWSLSGRDLSGLNDGTLSVTAELWSTGDASGSRLTGSTAATTSVLHDKVAPAVTISQGASATDATPVISGTSDLPAGSTIRITVDPDNNAATNDAVTYLAIVGAAGAWSVDTGAVLPATGSLSATGILPYAKISASGTDAAGNVTTTTALNAPTVTPLTTNATAPTISGTWTNITGDVLSVTVNGTTYTTGTSPALTVSGNTWSLVPNALTSGTYPITATVTRSGLNVSDPTTGELVINTSAPNVSITSASTQTTTLPLISGTTNATSVTVTIDPNNDGNWSDAITYNATVSGGTWTVDTGPAAPVSGSEPSAYSGQIGVKVTATTGGNSAVTNQTLTLVQQTPAVTISTIETAIASGNTTANRITGDAKLNSLEDDNVTISGTLQGGSSVSLTVSDIYGNTIYVTPTVSGTTWSATGLNLSTLSDGTLTVKATVTGTSAEATSTAVTHDKTPPLITIQTQSVIAKNQAIISGTSECPSTNLTVEVYLAGTSTLVWSSTTVATDASGNWTVTTPNGTNLISGNSGTVDIKVKPTSTYADNAGNIVQQAIKSAQQVKQGQTASTATIAIGTIAGDNVITSAPDEISSGLTISGTTSLTTAAAGSFTITIDDGAGHSVTALTANITNTSGTWTARFTNADIKSLNNGVLNVTAQVTDTATSSAVTTVSHPTLVLSQPTLSITDNVPGTLGGSNPVTFTFTFSENVTGFDATDVTVGNGTKGTFTAVDGKTYTLSVTPSLAVTGSVTVSVGAQAATGSISGKGSLAATGSQGYEPTPPSVAIGSATLTNDPTPVITGTTNLPDGSVITIALDPDNNPATSNSVTYYAVVTGGTWSIDTGTALPYSGSLPNGGFAGTVGVTASGTNLNGSTAIATQPLTVDIVAPAIGFTSGSRTPSSTPTITGSTDLPAGSSISVTIDPNNDGDWSDQQSYLATVQTGGTWSVATSTPLSGTVGVRASGTDAAGNSATTFQKLTVDTNAPTVAVTGPLDWQGNANGILSGSEDDAVVVKGSTTGIADGSTLVVTVTDGVSTIMDTVTVTGNSWSMSALNLSALANGTISVTARYYDDAGNTYVANAAAQHDKSGTVSIDSISTDTSVPGDFVTSDNTLKFTGSASPGATVTLSLSGPSHTFSGIPVTANGSGVWTYDYSGTTLTDGTYTLQAVSGTTATQTIVVDSTAPAGAVTVNTQTTSDTTPTITGTATLGAGESLSVTVNGVTYRTGDSSLSYDKAAHTWSLTIPSGDALVPKNADVSGFDGKYDVTATISDTAGNKTSDGTSKELTIQDAAAPVIDLAPSDAGSINRSTSTAGSAVSLDANADPATVSEASDQVTRITVTVGGLLDGSSEKLTFGATTLAANGSDGAVSSVTVGGIAVNVSFASGVFTIQKANYEPLTAAEAQAVVRDLQYQNSAGSPSTGTRTFDISATDAAGNTSSAARSSVFVGVVDITPPAAPSIDLVASSDSGISNSDDITSATAPTIRVTLNGTGGSAPLAGDVVNLYEGVTLVGTATLTGADITAGHVDIASSTLAQGNKSFSATVTDAAGNASLPSSALAVQIDTTAPSLSSATANGSTLVLSYNEAASGFASTSPATGDFSVLVNGVTPVTVSNVAVDTTAETVTLTLGSAVANGDAVTVSYTAGTNKIQDVAGNAAANLVGQAVTNSTPAPGDVTPPTVTITAGQDSLKAGETTTVTFSFSEDVDATFTVGDISVESGSLSNFTKVDATHYTATYAPAADTEDAAMRVSVGTGTFSDLSGNANTVEATKDLAVDTKAPTASISIDTVTADNVVNISESAGTVAVTGTVGGDVQTGDTVTITVDGTNYTGTVDASRTFSINVPGSKLAADADLTVDASVTTTDAAGNATTATTTQAYTKDVTAPTASVTVNGITSDNVLNISEAAGTVAITGSVGGDVQTGDTVTITVDGTNYTGTVDASRTFSINVPGSKLAADTDLTIDASVTTTDAAGNSTTATSTKAYTKDVTAPTASVTVNGITSDNVLNISEAAGTVAVTGTVGGDVQTGDTVTITVDGTNYTGTVDASRTFSIKVPGSKLAADADLTVDASVTTTDAAGNATTATTTQAYTKDVTAPTASVTVNGITSDNVLNISEAAGTVAITGTVGGDVQTGDTVTITVDGTNYTGTVDASRTFSINVPGSKLAADADLTIDASVTTTDAAGNSTTATSTKAYTKDVTAPTASVTVNGITSDNVLNISEAAGTVAVTGTVGGDVQTGDTVTITVDGTNYTGTVDASRTFSINVPGSKLAADTDLTVDASVTTTDAAGNATTATTTQAYTKDITAPTASVTVNGITSDNVLNISEAAGTIAVTGTVGGDVQTGDTVTITVDGTNYTGTVNASRTFSINVPGSKLAADADLTIDASVTTTDAAGNSTTATSTKAYTKDVTAPTASVTVNGITSDNVLNISEAAGTVAITGTVGGDVQTGDTVTITVDGTNYTGTVDASRTFSINVPGSKLATDADLTVDASVTTTDAAGNSTTATSTKAYTKDVTAPTASVTVNGITSDNVLNISEAAGTVAITGSVGGDVQTGDTVTITVDGTNYTGTVDASRTFSINVPGSELAADADLTVDASVTTTDAAGNSTTATSTKAYTKDVTAPTASVTVNGITSDNVLNISEAAGTVAITGSVGGDVQTGDTVTITVDGTNYTGTVDASKTFAINVPGSKLAADADLSIDASMTTTDAAGNSTTATSTKAYTKDVTAPTASVTVNGITSDNVLNISEAAGTVAVTGTVGGDVQTGDTVTITVDGTNYTGTVDASRTFSINVPGSKLATDTDLIVDASVATTDAAGNSTTANGTKSYTLNFTPPNASVTLNTITSDNVLNISEAAGTVAITGTVGGDIKTGDTVTITVDGTNYTGAVDASGTFSINVSGSKLAADADSTIDASVTTTSAEGISATATNNKAYSKDLNAPAASVTVNGITSDNVLNISETASTVAITGTVGGDVQTGDTVTITVDGTNYTGTVNASRTFSINVPGSKLAADTDLTIDASVTTTDAAGNSTTATSTKAYAKDLTAPTASVTVNGITSDNVLNISEAAGTVAITGTVGGDVQTGDTVTITVDGTNYTGTVDASRTFSINVPGSKLAADADLTVDASVTTTDSAGNTTTATTTQAYTKDVTAPTASVTLNGITSDNVLNISEAAGTVAITGSVGGDVQTGDTVTITVDGTNYTGTVDASRTFSINVPGSKLAADADLTVDASVTTTDSAGNATTVTTTKAYTKDVTAPTASVTLNGITSDNVLNISEAAGTVAVTGTVGGDVQTGDTVTITVDGTNYTGTVDASRTFSINVPGSKLAADTDMTINASVTTTSAGGGSTTATTTKGYNVDVIPPSAPTINTVTDDFAPETGNVANNAYTNDTSPTVAGTAEAGSTVKVFDGGELVGTVVADNSGHWTFTAPSLGNGTHTFTASSTDAAGNSASTADGYTVHIDTTAPTPAIQAAVDDADTTVARVTDNGTIKDATPTLVGTSEPGSTVTIYEGTTIIGTATADSNGNWTVTPTAALSDGTHTFTAIAADAAGNSNTGASAFTLKIDTSTPHTTTGTDTTAAPSTPAPTTPTATSPSTTTDLITGTDSHTSSNQTSADTTPTAFEGTPAETEQSGVVNYTRSDMTAGQEGLFAAQTPSSQEANAQQATAFNLPNGVFVQNGTSDKVTLEATLTDGRPLPDWIKFDSSTGRFTAVPPEGTSGAVDIKVTAHDTNGNTAAVQFQLTVTTANTQGATSSTDARSGQSDASTSGGAAAQPTVPAQSSSTEISDRTSTSQSVGTGPATAAISNGVVVFGTDAGHATVSDLALYVVNPPAPQEVQINDVSTFALPSGVFRHSEPGAEVKVDATLSNGQPLPEWLSFDATTGRFIVNRPPANATGTFEVKVMASDAKGNAASTVFKLTIAPARPNAVPQKPAAGGAEPAEKPAQEKPEAPHAKNDRGTELSPHRALKGRASLADKIAGENNRQRSMELVKMFDKTPAKKGHAV